MHRNEPHCQQLCTRQAGSATAGAPQGEAPEPAGRLGASRLVGNFAVTAHRSNNHHKKTEKLGQLLRPLATLPVFMLLPFGGAKFDILLDANSPADKVSRAPRRPYLQLLER